MRQNLTVALDKQLVQQLRVIAAQRSTSISGMLTAELRSIVERHDRYENAKRQALAALDEGLHLGGKPESREKLHER